jgi:hypothetical protein
MEDLPLPLTVTLTKDSAKAVRVMSHVFGQSADQFVEMILKKFFFDQVDEDRTERVEMIAELFCEMPFPTESEAEQASYRLETFANLYGPNNSKDLQIRTRVLRYEDYMGFRFRKRLRILPGLWINLSKKGGSLSVGGRGATINVSPRGHRESVGLPGSALSYRTKRRKLR